MNKQLLRLSEIAQKPQRLVLGLMSGTSLDGLDLSLCRFKNGELKVLNFDTVEYDENTRKKIASVQSKPEVNLEQVCILHTELAHLFADYILRMLSKWEIEPGKVDLIASHGQTIYHRPHKDLNSTLQIVDGDHIAHKTGIITISDFRQKHVAKGGEGAPLAAIMDEKLFRHQTKHRALLNLGGIANFTWLPSKESNREIITSDTGPANTLINEAMVKYFNQPFDKDGKVAKKGNVHSGLLKYLLLEPYFRKPFPKTTGQEDFNLELVESVMKGYEIELSPQDLIATLTQLTVYSISRAFDELFEAEEFELYPSGGGIHNPIIMKSLKERLPNAEFKEFGELGVNPDAKEAVLMAFLANECVVGGEWELGKISFPG